MHSNIIPVIHPLITLNYGENFGFNGCSKYVMECLGEPQFDYWFFSGITGDSLAQVYSFDTACGWLFVGKRTHRADIDRIYRDTVLEMPRLLSVRTAGYCFGAPAFRAWADRIESDYFQHMRPEAFVDWPMHHIYVCNMATNGSCHTFLERALEKNPDMTFLSEVITEYRKLKLLWQGNKGHVSNQSVPCLESLGGGFNATLSVLQDADRCRSIAGILRQAAAVYDRIVAVVAGA